LTVAGIRPVHITVYCPACNNRYQLHEEMRGKRMRCVNTLCREVFEVREAGEKAETAPTTPPAATPPASSVNAAGGKGYTSGCIGDLVPLVTAEAAEELPAPPAGQPTQSSSVGDIVPLLSTEAAEAAPADTPSWQAAPPPVRRPADTASPKPAAPPTAAPVPVVKTSPLHQPPSVRRKVTPAEPSKPAPAAEAPAWAKAPPPVRQPAKSTDLPPPVPGEPPPAVEKPATAEIPGPATEEKNDDGPRVLVPGAWEPPPVLREGADNAVDWSTVARDRAPEGDGTQSEPGARPATRRFGPFVIVCLLLVIGVALVFLMLRPGSPEEQLRTSAEAAFKDGKYYKAAQDYGSLSKSFPESERRPDYEFYRGLALMLANVDPERATVDAEPAMQDFATFEKTWQGQPLLGDNKDHLWDIARLVSERVLTDLEKTHVQSDSIVQIETATGKVKGWLDQAKPYWPDPKAPPRSLTERIVKLEQQVALERRLIQFLKRINEKPNPTLEDIAFFEMAARELAFDKRPQVQQALKALEEKALPSVQYQPRGWDMPFRAGGTVAVTWGLPGPGLPIVAGLAARLSASMLPPLEIVSPGLLVGPRVGPLGAPPSTRGVVFALARGVLYALAEQDGRILWATRVGIDTTRLPVRVAATQVTPEIVLVLSSDSNTLTARRVADGAALWQQHLPAPCLGRPVVVERNVQQPEGGVYLSRRAYVGTLNGRVLEIEIGSGNVLGEYVCKLPLVVGGAREPGTTLLYFPADRGYVFVLDVALQKCVAVLRTGHPSGSLRGEPILASEGMPAATPSHAELRYLILCQTSGLEQMKLRAWDLPADWRTFADKPAVEYSVRGWSWFEPYADGEKIALTTDAGVLGLYGIKQRNNSDKAVFPLLGEGRDAISLGLGRQPAGRTQVVYGTESDFWVLAQGELQHWRLGIDREKGLMVGSEWPQALPLGSALHAGQVNATGDTLFVVTQLPGRHTVVASAVDAVSGDIRWQRQLGLLCTQEPAVIGGPVIALDQSGELFLFDPAQHPYQPGLEWQFVQEAVLAAPAQVGPGRNSQMLAGPDGALYLISQGVKETVVRRYLPGKKANEPTIQPFSFHASWTGTPALAGTQMIVPLSDGSLARFALAKDSRPDGGPDWRALEADAGAPGHVVHLSGDEFLYTDGSNRLHKLTWPAGGQWKLPDKQKLQLPPLERIVAVPLVLPSANAKVAPRVLVADASGTLTLLSSDSLQKIRIWHLRGPVTAGPFRRGSHVGCVVDERLLFWIDPDQPEAMWAYRDAGGEAIVGQPQRIGERVVLAHRNGRYVSLDAQTGQSRGKGYSIRASAAPAAAAVAFGADRIFAPLTDGTVLLLPLEELERE
jgi:outer membrane protein assembly factor BamB